MGKTTGSVGLELIKKEEGCKLEAYKCPAGVWTIGYGHTGTVDGKAVSEGMKITQAKADLLLKSDLSKFEKYVNSKNYVSGFIPNQNQFDALVSFTFNCGPANLKMLCQNNRTAKEVAAKIPAYNKSGGKALSGLTARRKAEQGLFNTLVIPSVINKESEQEVILWMQTNLNKVSTGLAKLTVDGTYGSKTQAYVVAVWKKWGWKPSSGKAIGKKTIEKLKKV